MTVSLRDSEARSILDLLALPGDDWKPEDWAVFDVARQHLTDLKRRIGRSDEARTRSAMVDRVGNYTRPKRKADPPELVAARTAVRARSGGRCEAQIHGWCSGAAGHAHHVLRRSQGGQHTVENLVDVCPNDHAKIHANVEWAQRHGLLRSPGGALIAPVAGCSLACDVDHRPTAEPR